MTTRKKINKNIPLETRGDMYDIRVRSTMLYGAETWAMTGATENIMKRNDRRMLRYIAGVKWQDGVTSEEIAKRCDLIEIQDKIRQQRLQWFGHVQRENDGGILKN